MIILTSKNTLKTTSAFIIEGKYDNWNPINMYKKFQQTQFTFLLLFWASFTYFLWKGINNEYKIFEIASLIAPLLSFSSVLVKVSYGHDNAVSRNKPREYWKLCPSVESILFLSFWSSRIKVDMLQSHSESCKIIKGFRVWTLFPELKPQNESLGFWNLNKSNAHMLILYNPCQNTKYIFISLRIHLCSLFNTEKVNKVEFDCLFVCLILYCILLFIFVCYFAIGSVGEIWFSEWYPIWNTNSK